MENQKINFGIDLGTTNSAIVKVENGVAKIIRSTDGLMDTTPSVIHVNKSGHIFAGLKALNQLDGDVRKLFSGFKNNGSTIGLNTFSEFKRTMGTDKSYYSSNSNQTFSSEELSAEVLKKLKSYVIDEEIKAAVITVPAKFRQNQLDATQKAALLAGFEYCELLQEPIAASIAYGLDTEKISGYWLVFDFGGGTFDVALMNVDEGIMKVVDTEGDNHLGSKNIDYAIIDSILIPYIKKSYSIDEILMDSNKHMFLRDSLKRCAESAKIELSNNEVSSLYMDDLGIDSKGKEIIIDITLSLSKFETIAIPIFQRAIDITKKLIARNNLNDDKLSSIILVGGPTMSHTLRKLLSKQFTSRIDTSIDSMTAVARGAALYASLKDVPTYLKKSDFSKVQLLLKYPETSVESSENCGVRIIRDSGISTFPQNLFAELSRIDGTWSSGRIALIDDVEIFSLPLIINRPNTFTIQLFDKAGNLVQCDPSSFTIIQGLSVASATLPYNIGIDLFDPVKRKIGIYTLKGLEKNTSLPAKGNGTFKTQKDLRPGNTEDFIKIELYECGYGEEGSRKIFNELINTIIINGDDIPAFLPAGSEVEINLKIDSSRRIDFSAYFPYFDDSVNLVVKEQRQSEIDAENLFSEINKVTESLENIQSEKFIFDPLHVNNLKSELIGLNTLLVNGKNDYNTKTLVMERLRDIFKQVDVIYEENEWPKIKEELEWIFERVKINGQRYGNSQTNARIIQFQNQVNTVLKQSNVKFALQLIEDLKSYNFNLIKDDIGYWISHIKKFESSFDDFDWMNKPRARQLLDEALNNISSNPSKPILENAVRELFSILQEQDKIIVSKNDETTLMR